MEVTLVQVPYDSGQYAVRMGRGPARLLEAGLDVELEADGHVVRRVMVSLDPGFHSEIGAAAALYHQVRQAVAEARAAGRFPLVLAGNCNLAALGTVAGLRRPGGSAPSIVWLDAHGDFNTPDTSPSGFFDGMALSVLTGGSWPALAGSLDGFSPVPEDHVLLVGARDLDGAEAALLADSEVAQLSVEALRDAPSVAEALAPGLGGLAARSGEVYLHLDLDVLDPEDARANVFAAPGGLHLAEALELVEAVADTLPLAAAAITSFDPSADPEDRATGAAKRLGRAVARRAGRAGS